MRIDFKVRRRNNVLYGFTGFKAINFANSFFLIGSFQRNMERITFVWLLVARGGSKLLSVRFSYSVFPTLLKQSFNVFAIDLVFVDELPLLFMSALIVPVSVFFVINNFIEKCFHIFFGSLACLLMSFDLYFVRCVNRFHFDKFIVFIITSTVFLRLIRISGKYWIDSSNSNDSIMNIVQNCPFVLLFLRWI